MNGAPGPAGPRRWRPAACAAVLLGGLALLGPMLAPYPPDAQDLMRVMEPPSASHWLGTDLVGRDVLARVLAGAPHSLGLALVCVVLAAATGMTLGMVAANAGPTLRTAILRLADLMLACPGLLLALLFAGFLGGGIWPMLIGLKLSLWPHYARMAEAIATGALRENHVEAARLAAFPERTILVRHVLPPVLRGVMPLATLGAGQAIMSISALGFLGLGLKPPTPEWGAMINELMPFLAEGFVQVAAPCAMIVLSVLVLAVAGRSMGGSSDAREHG
ncbi:ABC transporter permease [uncultured Alsobacter sp.]|uniref:ABC transporter permease n=1 Tax=uncultured Alsobacter sp. TaxID=1748258 RepID=UPI0025FE31CB|nr:ABC transporter permease [uncultured Alsobacter sp.]